MLRVFMMALVFLSFDIRARDERERMHEVLDTRPVDNLAMLIGRLLVGIWVAVKVFKMNVPTPNTSLFWFRHIWHRGTVERGAVPRTG